MSEAPAGMASAKVTPLSVPDHGPLDLVTESRPSTHRRVRRYTVDTAEGPKVVVSTIEVEEDEESGEGPQKKTSYFRDPLTPVGFVSSNAPFMQNWDMTMLFLLTYTAIVTPFEVSFLNKVATDSALFSLNRFIDGLFLLDMMIQFRLVPASEDSAVDTSRMTTKQLKRMISRTYLRGYFIIDIASIFPYDLFVTITESVSGSDVGLLRVLRVVRLTRLGKLLRIFKTSQVITRIDDEYGFSYAGLRIFKFLLLALFMSHWLACCWHCAVLTEDAPHNWVEYYADGQTPVLAKTTFDRYLVAWYWSIMTVTTIGYGDVVPRTNAERIVAIFAMLLGAGVYAFILGNVTSLVAALDIQMQEYYLIRDTLSEFMNAYNLPHSLRRRLRQYFRYRLAQGETTDWSTVTNQMSLSLQQEVSMYSDSHWISGSFYLQDQPTDVIGAIAAAMVSQTFGSNEKMMRVGELAAELFIIKKGVCFTNGKMNSAGKTVGTDMLYYSINSHKGEFLRTCDCTAMSFVATMMLTITELQKLFKTYPDLREYIRRKVRNETFKENMTAYAIACGRVKGEISPLERKGFFGGVNHVLVEKYEWKLRLTQHVVSNINDKPTSVDRILKLQNVVRAFLARKKVKGKMAERRDNTWNLHQDVISLLTGIANRLERIETHIGLEPYSVVNSQREQVKKQVSRSRATTLQTSNPPTLDLLNPPVLSPAAHLQAFQQDSAVSPGATVEDL